MAAEMLLINPSGRRKARRSTKKTAKRRTARRVTARAAPRRRRNPIAATRRRVMARPGVRRRRVVRRRNPINLGSTSSWMGMLRDAAVGGAGAVAIDLLMGQITPMLPVSMQRTPGTLGLGDAIKVGITVGVGMLLSKPTKGLSKKMAAGALTVQAAEVFRSFVPDTMTLGYATPATVRMRGNNRVGQSRLARFQSGSPLLGMRQAGSAMLNGTASAREAIVR